MVIFAGILPDLRKEILTRLLALIALVVAGMLLSTLLIWVFARVRGISIDSEYDLMSLLGQTENASMVKVLIGFNHLMTFLVSSMAYVFIFYRHKMKEWLQLYHFNPLLLILFPLALFSLYPLMGYTAFFVNKLELPEFLQKMDQDAMTTLSRLLTMENLGDLAANLLLVGVLAGVGEELLFRGIIQKEIIKYWRKPHAAIWITSVLFGLFHFQVVGFLPKMGIGLVLGYAYHYSGSLILPMIIHILNNSLATVSLYLSGGKLSPEEIPAENIPLAGVLVSTCIFTLLMVQIRKISQNKPTEIS